MLFTSTLIPSYVYTYIKINFLKQLIIRDESLSELKEFNDIREFIEFIQPYYPEINITNYDIVEIEQALFHILIKIIGKILHFSPENMRLFLRSLFLKYEISNIKQIILGSIVGMSKADKSQRVNFLVEEYLEHSEFINNLIEIDNLDEIQLYFKKTRYNKAIREGILYFKNTNEIFVLEAFLDKLFYENLILTKPIYSKKELAMISLYIAYSTEVYNLRMLSRAIINNFDKNLTSQLLVDEYLFLDRNKIDILLESKNINDFSSKLENFLSTSKELKNFFVPIIINVRHLRWSFEGIYQNYYFKKFQLKIDDFEYFTIYRILELIIKKEREIKFNIMPNVIRIIHNRFERLKE
ncbi:MAG: V-type ATPase subunit [Candidatus Hodarchaeota archaeon]